MVTGITRASAGGLPGTFPPGRRLSSKTDLPPKTNERARAVFWLQVVSLIATGWVILRIAYFPFGAQNFLPAAVAIALWYSLCALTLSAVITFLVLLTAQRIARAEALDVTLRTCAAGMWFAPAVILLSASSPLAITAALALVVSVTRVLYSQWRLGPTRVPEPAEDAEPRPASLLTGELPHGFLPRDFWPAFLSAAALQAGFVFSRLAHRSLSGACYALGAGILTAYSIAAGVWTRDREPALPRSILAIAVTLMLTVLITIIGMQMYGNGSGYGDETGYNGTSNRRARREPPPPPKQQAARPASYEPPPIDPSRMGPSVSVPGGVPGVILWPETRPVPLLVEPLPKGGLANREASRPFVIPFAGSYWMFRSGFTRPPANSLVQRGTPTANSFKTVDMWPLEMEAHQLLDREIDISCCSKIRVEVLNADKHPGTVTVELGLIYHGRPPMRLGVAPILSRPDLFVDPVKPVPETLQFDAPSGHQLFDEFDVIFHRSHERVDRSARIAIERFVLEPR
jgi:hypothetical protein